MNSATPLAWRVVHRDFLDGAFNGAGARRHGGRWNPPGVAAVYASESLALAVLEVYAHLQNWNLLRERFCWLRVRLPASPQAIPLPPHWKSDLSASRAAGRQFLSSAPALCLKIPSALLPDSHNLLLAPNHPDFANLQPEGPFELEIDARL